MRKDWWKNNRGEWFVVVQFLLFALVAFGPKEAWGIERWGGFGRTLALSFSVPLILVGITLALTGVLNLGKNLTAVPHPKDDSVLVQHGAYRWVRHPIYSGIILSALGWACWQHSFLTLFYAVTLFLFFDIKSRQEERWLAKRYQNYGDYQRRVKKLLPFLY